MRTADSVRSQTGVALEVSDGSSGQWTEDAVGATAVEPDVIQRTLELGNIVTAKHRGVEHEETVTETPACFDQRQPCRLVTASADEHATLLLE